MKINIKMIDIIIPFYKNYDTIEHLLRSIDDQDYKNFNVVIVIDGEDLKASELLQSLQNKVNYTYSIYTLGRNSGASAARNHGAKNSRGDILFFIDADCKLYPGVLRDVLHAFELVPNIGFCYSNYRFEDTTAFHSQGYDPYLLETMNYICTMSPIKRDVFESIGGFDEDRKCFQDWGLFYKASKVTNGYYLGKNHYMFSTKKPTEQSISGTQGLTLDEKCKEFRSYYGIKDRSIVATTWGAPLQAIQRAKMLDADYVGIAKDSNRAVFPTNYRFENWKATYLVGCYNESLGALLNHLEICVEKPIIHFIGSDVFHMMNCHVMAQLIVIKKMLKRKKAIILVNSRRCQKELKLCGIKSKLVYTPIYNIEQYKVTKPLPEKFTVGVYVSDTNKTHMLDSQNGFSNIPLIRSVAAALPMINFKFFGIDKVYDKDKNIEMCGKIPENEMVDFINDCSMVIRSTIHDGFPQLPIQFLLCGRQALVSCPDKELKYCDKLSFEDNLKWENNKNEIINKIMEMSKRLVDSDALSKNSHDYYRELLNVEKYKEEIYSCLK